MKRTPSALALAAILGLAPLALAGGIAVHVTLDKSLLTPDAEGVITLALGIERGLMDCGGTALVDCDTKQPGPKVWLERRTSARADTWEQVKNPWAKPIGMDFRPRDLERPYRLDRGDRLRFSRRVKLEPGTYRVRVEIDLVGEDATWKPASSSFSVVAAVKKGQAKS